MEKVATPEWLAANSQLFKKGQEVFGSKLKFIKWLNQPVDFFEGKEPKTHLFTVAGIEILMQELGRIEHGIFC